MSKNTTFLLSSLAIILVLILSYFNLKSYFSSSQVLGAQTNTEQPNEKAKLFWEDFLNKNPTYFPGWIELARIEKERGINPNTPELNN